MRNTCLRLHPAPYAPGAMEALYEQMAQKGWLLEKRGVLFSRFRRGEPQNLRYRVEFANPTPQDEPYSMSMQQLALYQESGWKLAARRGMVYVFSAPDRSDIPDLYEGAPQLYAQSLGFILKRANKWWALSCLWTLAGAMRVLRLWGGVNSAMINALLHPVSTAAGLLFHLSLLCFLIFGAVAYHRLYRRLLKGNTAQDPLRRSSAGRLTVPLLLLLMTLLFGIQIGAYAAQQTSVFPLPVDGPVPFLQLNQLGAEGKHGEARINEARVLISPLAGHWGTSEVLTAGGYSISLSQDLYHLPSEELAAQMTPFFRESHPSNTWKSVDIPGLDQAYVAKEGYYGIAIQGCWACLIYYDQVHLTDPNDQTELPMTDILTALSQHLSAQT